MIIAAPSVLCGRTGPRLRSLRSLPGSCACRSENIAQAMAVRGFQGPEQQRLYMMTVNPSSWLANLVALAALGALCAVTVTQVR